MDAHEILKEMEEWNENYIASACGDQSLMCNEYCADKDCIVVRAIDLIKSLIGGNSNETGK